MTKKRKRARHNKNIAINRAKQEDKLIAVSDAMQIEKFDAAIKLAEQVAANKYASRRQKAEAWGYISVAHGIAQNFNLAYDAGAQALIFNPKDFSLWYNKALSAFYTFRTVEAIQCMEKALSLCDEPTMVQKIQESIRSYKELAEKKRIERGPDCTLEQLAEQEQLFPKAIGHMVTGEHEEAIHLLRRVIELGDCLPQPWFNIGSMLAHAGDYDGAEESWKRALEIDPDYEYAQILLARMPEIRKNGMPDGYMNLEPLKGKVKKLGAIQLER